MKDGNWINDLEQELGGVNSMGREEWIARFAQFEKTVDGFAEELNKACQAGIISKEEVKEFGVVCALRYPKQAGPTPVSVIMVGNSRGVLNAGFAIAEAFEKRRIPFVKMISMKMLSDMLKNKEEDDEDE